MKTIMLIIAIIIVLFIAVFSYCACVVSSKCNKYEGFHRTRYIARSRDRSKWYYSYNLYNVMEKAPYYCGSDYDLYIDDGSGEKKIG